MEIDPRAQALVQARVIAQLEAQIKELSEELQKGAVKFMIVKKANAYYVAHTQYLLQENLKLRDNQRLLMGKANSSQPVQRHLTQSAARHDGQNQIADNSRNNASDRVQNISTSLNIPAQRQVSPPKRSPVTSVHAQNSTPNTIRSNIFSSPISNLNSQPQIYSQWQIEQIQNNIEGKNQRYIDSQDRSTLNQARAEDQSNLQIRNNNQSQSLIQNGTQNTSQLQKDKPTGNTAGAVPRYNPSSVIPRPPNGAAFRTKSGSVSQLKDSSPAVAPNPSPSQSASRSLLSISPIGHNHTTNAPIQDLVHTNDSAEMLSQVPSPDISLAVPSSPVKISKQPHELEKSPTRTPSGRIWPLNLLNGLFSKADYERTTVSPTVVQVSKSPKDSTTVEPNITASSKSVEESTNMAASHSHHSKKSAEANIAARKSSKNDEPQSEAVDPLPDTARVSQLSPVSEQPSDTRVNSDKLDPKSLKSKISVPASTPSTHSGLESEKNLKLKSPKKAVKKAISAIKRKDDEDVDEILDDDEFQSNIHMFLEKGPLTSPTKPTSSVKFPPANLNNQIPPAESNSTPNVNAEKQTNSPRLETSAVQANVPQFFSKDFVKKPTPYSLQPLSIKTSASIPHTFGSSPLESKTIPIKITSSDPSAGERLSSKTADPSSLPLEDKAMSNESLAVSTKKQSPKKMKLKVIEISSDESLSDFSPGEKPTKRTKKSLAKRSGSDIKINAKSRKQSHQQNARIEELPADSASSTSEPALSFESILEAEKINQTRPASVLSSRSYQALMKPEKGANPHKFYAQADGKNSKSNPHDAADIRPVAPESSGIVKLSVKDAWYRNSPKNAFQRMSVAGDAYIKFVNRKGIDLSFRASPIENNDLSFIQLGNNGLELLFFISLNTTQEIFVQTYASVEKETVRRAIDPFYLSLMPREKMLLFDKLSKSTNPGTVFTVPNLPEPAKPVSFELPITKCWMTTPTLPTSPILISSEEKIVFSAKGVKLALRSRGIVSYSEVERIEYSNVAGVVLLILSFPDGENLWIKATGWSSGILEIVKCNIVKMKDKNINQFHKNDTGKFPIPDRYENLKRISTTFGKKSNSKSKAGHTSASSISLRPWVEVAKEKISGTSNMRKAEKNVFRGFVREYLLNRVGEPQDYLVVDPSTGKKDYGIPSERVDDFMDWYGKKAVEKHEKDNREMLQTIHKGEKLRAERMLKLK